MRKFKLFFACLLMAVLSIGQVWAVEYDALYESGTFSSLDAFGYTQNKTFTLNDKGWKASVAQVNSSVFYLGCNSGNAEKGVLNNNSDFSDIVTALASADATYNTNKTTAHAYALLFNNSYDNVTKVEFTWDGGNNAFQVYLFGYTGTAWTKLANTNYASSGAAVSGSVTWTGSATNYSKFAIAARPGTTSTTATSKTIRPATFKIYKTKAAAYTITAVSNNDLWGTVSGTTTITANPSTGYRVKAGNAGYTVTSGTATVTNNGDNTFSVTPSANCTVQINFEAIPTHNIIFNNGGVKSIANAVVAEGESYDITETIENSLIASCTYKKFEGWTLSSPIANANVKPTLVTSVEMEDEDVDLYAVYSITSGSGSGAAVDATLFSENFGGFESGNKMEGSQSTETGNRFVYNSGSVTYSYSNGTSADTKIYEQNSAGGSSPELLVGKNNSTFTITSIPTGSANTAILTYHSNQSSNLTVTTTTENVTIGNVSTDATDTKLCSRTITFSEGAASTFNMTFTMTTSSNARLDDIEIIVATTDAGGSTTYSLDAGCAAPGQCVAPTFDPGQGTYDAAQSVELATTTDGADIYYTTDNSTPSSTNGTKYTSAISVTQNTTIKAIAIKDGMTDSEVSTGEFKIRFATAPTIATTATPVEEKYTSAIEVTITATDADHIYYTTNGNAPEPGEEGTLEYNSAISLSTNGSHTIKAIAVKAGYANSNVASAAFVLDLPYANIKAFIDGEKVKAANDRVLQSVTLSNAIITGRAANYNNQNVLTSYTLYVQDETAGIMIYALPTDLDAKAAANHSISGTIKAMYTVYRKQHEMAKQDNTHPIDLSNVEFSDDVIARPSINSYTSLSTAYATDSMKLVKLTNVKYESVDSKYNATFNEQKIYNTFQIFNASTVWPESNVDCDITGIVIDYNGTYELLPVFASDVVADADAAAPVFTPAGGADAENAVQVDLNSYVTIAAADAKHSVDVDQVQITSTDPVSVTAVSSRDFYRSTSVTKWYYGNSASASYDINGQGSTTEGTIVAQVNSVDAPSAKENDEVHILITPNTHFALNTITVNGSAPTEVSAGTEYKFTMPAEVVTIAVTWNEDAKVNVQFAKGKDAAEGTIPSTMSGKYENDVITLPANPFTLTSWKFKGWKHSLTDAIHQPGSYTITAADVAEDAITFAAEWEAMPDFEHGDWTLVTDVAELTEGSYVMIAAADDNYAMKPWVSNANHCVRKAATKDGEFLTYDSEFAIFEVKNYVVAEEVVGKSFLNVNSAKYLCYSSGLKEQTAQADASAWTLSFDGSNVFHAYNKNATTYEIQYNNNSGTERFACYAGTQNAIALYKYHTPSLKLTYDKNAGDDVVTEMPSMGIADGDNKVTISDATPLREGYLFDGWNSNPLGGGTVYEANHEYTLTANLTIYAQWQTATAHPLSYDKDGGEGDVPAAADYYPNVNVTLANAVTKEGYIFAGWEYDGNIYAAGTSFTMPNDEVVMKAKYATGAVYTITAVDAVEAQGAPESSNATFANTYTNNKNQMTGGNSMTLTLTGYDLYTIKAITLNMKSNNNSGQGTLSVTIGSNPVSFTTNKWYNGTYKSGSYEDIKVTLTPTRVLTGENIVIEIAASANSLYCQSFAIEYERVLDDIRTNLSDGKWGTICPKQEVKYPTGAAFYQLTYMEQNPDNSPYKFFFDEIAEGASLEAGKPYLFIAEGEAVKGIKVGAEAADGDHAYNGFVGYLGTSNKALASDAYTFTDGGYNYYGLQNNIFKLIGSGQMLNERAYVEVSPDRAPSTTPVPMPAYSRRRLVVGAGAPQVTTGMDELNASETPVKVMIDGNLYILRGEKMYDATGRLVK